MSNSLGDIYGTVKNGKSCIKLESEIVDINGIEINSDGSSLVPISNGMVVQVQHKDYKKTVDKNSTGWTAIDNDLETGFVVAIQPSSSASNVLVSCNLHVNIYTPASQHYWGARLYRKIGNGDWTHLSEADGEQTDGTPIWLTDNSHNPASDMQYRLMNLGNKFLDSPNTTETVYYTIYWANIYQDNVARLLHLNRSSIDNTDSDDDWHALPISNITAKEIWNSGKIYTPPATLITTDEINNLVNITGNLKLSGDLVETGGGAFMPIRNGMIIQVQHKDYKKSVTKNGNYWDDIDNNLETGFVVAIQPSSSASNVLVSCNLHIGINQSQDARWWGARLYRKIGGGNWTHVSEADNNQSNGASGTSVWLSDNMGIHSTEANTKISNLGNSFLDSPNTTETVYYTIYWKSRLGESVGNDTIYLNRAASSGDAYRALPTSSITAKEIWNAGEIYIPPTTLITTDEINNVVNVTSNLTVANKKVITVPTTDSDGNALTADTTYEMTTGPAGSINNISFVKKQQAFINWECTGSAKNFNLNQIRDGGNGSDIIGAGHVTSGKNLISTSTITRGGQQVVQASNIDINTPANGRITVTLPGLYSISAEAGGYLTTDERYFALTIYINDTQYGARMVSQVNGTTQDGSNGHGMVSISAVAMLEAQDVIHFTITGGSQDNANIDNIQGQIVKIN